MVYDSAWLLNEGNSSHRPPGSVKIGGRIVSSQGSHNAQGKDQVSKHRVLEGSVAQILGGLGLAAILAGVAAINGVFGGDPGGGAGGATSPATPTSPSIPQSVGPTPPMPTANPTPVPTSVPTPMPTPTPAPEPPPPPALTGFRVTISEPRNAVYGEKEGPNTFKRDDQHGKVVVSYTWEAIMSNKTVNNNADCAIHAEVSGPQWVNSMDTDECTFTDEGSISFSDDNVQEYSEPGRYTVTVTDKITGVKGTATFTVI